MVFIVTGREDLRKLIAKLKDANSPRATAVIGTAHNLKEGKITAKVFTDEWPNFLAVVCHITSPKITKVSSVFCYATSDSALIGVLKDSGVVLNGSAIAFANCHADILLQEFPQLKLSFEGTPYYLPASLKGDDRLCPSGFTVRKLTPSQDQAEVISSYWKYMENGPEKISRIQCLIENGHSCAVYTSDNTNTPVSWGMQYPHGHFGHVYTLPEYRRRGLATIVVRELCKLVIADGLTPVAIVELGNPISGLFLNLGFLEAAYRKIEMTVTLT